MYLKIWDVGGQHSLRKLWQSYYRSCHAIVFVIDSSDVGDADLGFLEAGKKGGGQSHRRTASSLGGGTYTAAVGSRSRSPKEEGGLTVGGQEGGAEAGARGGNSSKEHTGRLEECKLVLESVLASADTVGVPVLVLANKQDREDCVETVKIKEGLVRPVFEGERGAGVRDSRVLPVSALTGAGVSEAVEWVRSRVKWNKEGRPPAMR
ncbi:MAG: hypothetical protein LQ340_007377 [Diploschistes diacapsis]|nr:MAG: hypothetical protein LQ340_007377 [Diploschistes diacapsis]